MVITDLKMPPPTMYDEETYRHVKSLDWNTSHSRRVWEGAGDDGLRVAFDPARGCWVVATLCRVQVVRHFGAQRITDVETLPRIWGEWREDPTDPETAALSITDPRLIPWVRKCSTRRAGTDAILADVDLHRMNEEKRQREFIRERHQSSEVFEAFRLKARQRNIVAHRKTGPNAKKISSAGLWQRGATAKPAQGSIILASA